MTPARARKRSVERATKVTDPKDGEAKRNRTDNSPAVKRRTTIADVDAATVNRPQTRLLRSQTKAPAPPKELTPRKTPSKRKARETVAVEKEPDRLATPGKRKATQPPVVEDEPERPAKKVSAVVGGSLNPAKVLEAVSALSNYLQKSQSDGAAKLGDAVDFFSLIVTLKTIPSRKRTNPYKIPLKHTLHPAGESSVCFIVKDPQREVKDLLAEKGSCGVTKVLGVSKLRARYKTFEAKRRLCSDYDLFLCDRRVLPMLPKLLGKPFFYSKKLPGSVDLTKNIERELKAATSCTYLFLGQGNCSSIRVARTSFTPEQVTENVVTAMDAILPKLPAGLADVQSVYIKSAGSPALTLLSNNPN